MMQRQCRIFSFLKNNSTMMSRAVVTGISLRVVVAVV
jgi:hypothetical protein